MFKAQLDGTWSPCHGNDAGISDQIIIFVVALIFAEGRLDGLRLAVAIFGCDGLDTDASNGDSGTEDDDVGGDGEDVGWRRHLWS